MKRHISLFAIVTLFLHLISCKPWWTEAAGYAVAHLFDKWCREFAIEEFMELVLDASTDKLMDEAEARGCNVFDGIEGNTVQ